MQIPYELLEKLMGRGICRAIFYLGVYLENREFCVLDGRPLDK